jgi:hypothetical protein
MQNYIRDTTRALLLAAAATLMLAAASGCRSVLFTDSESVDLSYYAGPHGGYFGRHPSFPRTRGDVRPNGTVKWGPIAYVSDQEWRDLVGCVCECLRPEPTFVENVPAGWDIWRWSYWLLTATVRGPILAVEDSGGTWPNVVVDGGRWGRITNSASEVIVIRGTR